MAKGTGEWKRIVIWCTWTLNMLLNAIYICLTFATSQKLIKTWRDLDIGFNNSAWRAPIAATTLGGIMVLMFNIMSCFILIKKSINRSGPGFGYGFILSWCFVMCFFTLLCGLVTDSFGSTVEKDLERGNAVPWSKYNTGAYHGTTAFAYICCAFYLFFFLCLIIFQGGIMKQIGLYDPATDQKRKMEMAKEQQLAMNPLAAGNTSI